MPNLVESLQGRDLGHLRIIAELWGFDLQEQDISLAILNLTQAMQDPSALKKLVNSLPAEVNKAFIDLARHSGRIAWAQFSRMYGEVREIGIARRDREQPYKQPISAVEALWYRGLVGRAFFDTPAGPEEFAYIPEELLVLQPQADEINLVQMGRQASSAEYARVFLANDHILDHACTQLAAIRLGIQLPESFSMQSGELLCADILGSLLAANGLLDSNGKPAPEPVRLFLEASRGKALVALVRSWMQSTSVNELRMIPSLSFEGNWENDPLRTRQVILDYLASIPPGTWWSIQSFIAAIKHRNPDFERPAGDYDSWFIRHTKSGEYLRGFDHWEQVDGRLIRYILTGPLHWLGILDLASPESEQEITAFRFSRWSQALLRGEPPKGLPVEKESLAVRSDGRISAGWLVPRKARYQLSRFCDWEKETPQEYWYRVSSQSLKSARKQGLTVSQLVALLNRYGKTIPPSLVKALERWETKGSEARLEKMVILRVASAEVLQALRKSRANRFLGEPLSPTAVTIKSGAVDKVLAGLAELGYLGEIRDETGEM